MMICANCSFCIRECGLVDVWWWYDDKHVVSSKTTTVCRLMLSRIELKVKDICVCTVTYRYITIETDMFNGLPEQNKLLVPV